MTVTGAPVPMSLPMPAPRVAALLDPPTVRVLPPLISVPRVSTPRSAERSKRSALMIAVDVVGHAGSMVTLAAALVVGAAVGGTADGVAPTGNAATLSHATLSGR